MQLTLKTLSRLILALMLMPMLSCSQEAKKPWFGQVQTGFEGALRHVKRLFIAKDQELSQHTLRLTPAIATISVENKTAGTITLSSWDNDTVFVECIKAGTAGERANLRYAITPTTTELVIHGSHAADDKENNQGTISFLIKVPAKKQVVIQAEDGTCTIEGLFSDLQARSKDGNISATTNHDTVTLATQAGAITLQVATITPEAAITVQSDKGDITLYIPEKSEAILQAVTHKGTIASDIPVTLQAHRMKLSRATWHQQARKIYGMLGEATAPSGIIVAESTRGSISIMPLPADVLTCAAA
jgi:DUF4097 and DUF4098 domain-containing protein YvlB